MNSLIKEPEKFDKVDNVPYEFMINLDGTIMYQCQLCGRTYDQELIAVHAEEQHLASYISLYSIPITKKSENTDSDTQGEKQNG